MPSQLPETSDEMCWGEPERVGRSTRQPYSLFAALPPHVAATWTPATPPGKITVKNNNRKARRVRAADDAVAREMRRLLDNSGVHHQGDRGWSIGFVRIEA